MLYHVSDKPGLKILKPHLSSHGTAYVYAIEYLVTALLFGAKKDDFDLMMDENDGKTVVCECYPNAFRNIYDGKSCFVYEIEENGFQKGITGWEPEWVCAHPVRVIREWFVPDLFEWLMQAEQEGKLIIRQYSEEVSYKRMISEHIVDRLIRFDLLERFDKEDARGEKYYRALIDGLKQVMDGHLL